MFVRFACAVVLALAVGSSALTIECESNRTITITVLNTDVDYINKTIRQLAPCVIQYGPVATNGGVYSIALCNDTTFDLNIEYSFLFQINTDYWSGTDKLVTFTCAAGITSQTFNQTIGVTAKVPDVTATDIFIPQINAAIKSSNTPVTTATVGDAITVEFELDSLSEGGIGIGLVELNVIHDNNVVSLVDTFCETSDASDVGITGITRTLNSSIVISLSAFIMTTSNYVSTTGNTVLFNAEIRVCPLYNITECQANCTDNSLGVGRRRRRAATEESSMSTLKVSESLMVFPTKQSENEFLASIADQLDLGERKTSENKVCVDRAASFSVIAILVGHYKHKHHMETVVSGWERIVRRYWCEKARKTWWWYSAA